MQKFMKRVAQTTRCFVCVKLEDMQILTGKAPQLIESRVATKENILQSVQQLPNDTSIEHVMEKLVLLAKVEEGITQANAGITICHQELKQRLINWRY